MTSVPRTGTAWHADILADGLLEIPGVRPAVYPKACQRDWDALLRFRHFLWHAYAVRLDPEELGRNREHLERAVAATEPSIAALIDSLS